MLPDFLIPYKHYTEETVTGVLDGVVSPDDEDSETFPSETTMIRWLHWFITNLQNIEGYMRSIGYRLLGFSEELLKSGDSLLDSVRSSFPDTWIKDVLRWIYNSGNKLQPFYG